MKKNLQIAENVQFKKHLINFSVSLIILLTSFFITSSFLQKTVYENFTSENALFILDTQIIGENHDFSYYIKNKNDDIKTEFTALIKEKDISKIDDDFITIFTPKMQCEAFELYVNGINIAVEGDIVDYNSNIWAQKYCYTVDSNLFNQKINELKIVQYSRYMSGGLGLPFIIDGYHSSIMLRNFKTIDIYQAIYGISAFMLLLVMLVISLFAEKRKYYLVILASIIFLMIGYIEYFQINHLGMDYLLFKKIIVSSELLAIGIGTVFFRKVFDKTKHSSLFLLCYSTMILVPTFFAVDMITYKTIYTVLTFAVVPLLLYWGYLAIKNYKKNTHSKLLLALAAACVFYTMVWNIGEITKVTYLDSIVVVIMPAYIITVLALILIDFHELRMNMAASNKKFTKAYKKSIVDGLTNLYNAEHMKDIITNTDAPFAFVVYDIDNFKKTNDTYGHLAGDEALIKISEEISKLLRDGDVLSRYGGDEFILLLKLSSAKSVEAILERIRKHIEDFTIEFDGQTLYMTISIGYYIANEKQKYKDMLYKADRALYHAKNEGKNRIISFDNISGDF